MDKSFKITKQSKTNIENYNKTIYLNDSMKKKFKQLLSVFDSDGSGNLETKNKDGKNEVEAYFNAVINAAQKSGNKLELDINEAQDLIDNKFKNSKVKATDLIEFSKIITKTIDVSTACNNINNFTNRNNVTTKNISALTNIAKTQITSDNVLEVLEKYKKQNGQSFFDTIADYKLADDNERKELILDVFNKLVANVKARGKDIELLEQLGIEEIKYQFDKTGFIDKNNVNAFFDALTIIAHRETTNLRAGKNDKYINEFKLPEYKSKKEHIGKFQDTILGKTVTYSLADGTTINEEYTYDSKKKKYVMETRRWKNEKGEDIKTATYYNGDENSIRSVHMFKDNKQVETHFYRQNGVESATTYSTNGQFRSIQFGENGVAEQDSKVKNPNTNNPKETTTYFDENGEKYRGSSAVYEGIIKKYENLESLANLYALTSEEADFDWLPKFTMPNRMKKFDERTQINIMKVLFEKCKKHPSNDGAKIDNLKNQALKYIEEGELQKAWSCYEQAFGRATVNNNRRLKNDKNKEVLANGKIDKDFKQGNFGTCWLTSAIKSLSLNPNGQKILDETVKKDPKTGNITVTLKGAPKGQQVYTYTQKQINEASELTTGDGDERAVEMAFRDLFMKNKSSYKKSDNTLNGNNLKTAFEILTGNDVIEYFEFRDISGSKNYTYDSIDEGNNCQGVRKYLQGKLDNLIGKKNLVAQCSFVSNFDTMFTINKQGTKSSAQIYTGHAYSLKAVDKTYVYVVNPWDTSETVKIARKDFEKYCMQITTLDI